MTPLHVVSTLECSLHRAEPGVGPRKLRWKGLRVRPDFSLCLRRGQNTQDGRGVVCPVEPYVVMD